MLSPWMSSIRDDGYAVGAVYYHWNEIVFCGLQSSCFGACGRGRIRGILALGITEQPCRPYPDWRRIAVVVSYAWLSSKSDVH